MADNGNGNHQAVQDILDRLTPEDQTALLTRVVGTMVSPEVRKNVATEAAQALPTEVKKEVAAEAAQALSPEARKDVATETVQALGHEARKDVVSEAAQALPTEGKKEVAAEAAQALPHEVKKDFIDNAFQGLSKEDRKDITGKAFQQLDPKDRRDVAGNPSQIVTDKIWLTIVYTFAFVLVASAGGLLYVSIWPPTGEANPTQVMLPVFTSIAGILAGFISGRASAGG